jgi:hypothetical protein
VSRDPEDLRRSLDDRFAHAARQTGSDVNRLRRRFVFQRAVARLAADGRWVLKGGYALEARLPDRARATQDVDVALLAAEVDLGIAVRDSLAVDPDGDSLIFTVGAPKRATGADDDPTAWRFPVEVRLAGRIFDRLRLDVGVRVGEVDGAVEDLSIAVPIPGLDLPVARVPAVDVAQHAAEKIHALTRIYAFGRPSSRVKDLVDLVLLLDAGLLPHPRLGQRLRHVYAMRDGVSPPPLTLPDPPPAWQPPFADAARELRLSTSELQVAVARVTALVQTALADDPNPPTTNREPAT